MTFCERTSGDRRRARNILARHAKAVWPRRRAGEAAEPPRAREGPPAGAAPLPPHKTRFSPRLARALFMSLLMHSQHLHSGLVDAGPQSSPKGHGADAF